MVEKRTPVELAAGRQHIIERPRLTRILDETSAQIILLVAPAGYGKTTLARQWIEMGSRQAVWYRCSPATADVAAFAAGLAKSISRILPGAGKSMLNRLRATRAPDKEVTILAELVAEDLTRWPEGAWLVIDDYHLAAQSESSEQLIDTLVTLRAMPLLLTSRWLPRWATARRLIYGEVLELTRADLAMNPDEAREVLSRSVGTAPDFISRAKGWPAIIGLASSARNLRLPNDYLPAEIYRYFAEELFQGVSRPIQDALRKLALPPIVSEQLAETLLGEQLSRATLREASKMGFLSDQSGESFELHPLLRDFLLRKIKDPGPDSGLVEDVASVLIRENLLDEAFLVATHFPKRDFLNTILEVGLQEMLDDGRIATLRDWLGHAKDLRLDSPFRDLAEAEVALRSGDYSRAETLALRAAKALGAHTLCSRALFVAGQAAHLLNRETDSLHYHRRAAGLAKNEADRAQALWGEFLSLIDLEDSSATRVLDAVSASEQESPDQMVRHATGRLLVGSRMGGLSRALSEAKAAVEWIPWVDDPMIASSFLNAYGHLCAIAGHFHEALKFTDEAGDVARKYRLKFAFPYIYLARALALMGLRRFADSARMIEAARREGEGDLYVQMHVQAVQARHHLSHRRFTEALDATSGTWGPLAPPGMHGEFLAIRALALACSGNRDGAVATIARVRKMTRETEPRALCLLARAILSVEVEANAKASPRVIRVVRGVRTSGCFLSLVTAYRAAPELLTPLAELPDRIEIADILQTAHDTAIARDLGLAVQPDSMLSKRETEVHDLLSRGLSNRGIAQTLFISEATVKVHVRHIFEKFGVRTRTQAALVSPPHSDP